jgi:hypothetical protein
MTVMRILQGITFKQAGIKLADETTTKLGLADLGAGGAARPRFGAIGLELHRAALLSASSSHHQ